MDFYTLKQRKKHYELKSNVAARMCFLLGMRGTGELRIQENQRGGHSPSLWRMKDHYCTGKAGTSQQKGPE